MYNKLHIAGLAEWKSVPRTDTLARRARTLAGGCRNRNGWRVCGLSFQSKQALSLVNPGREIGADSLNGAALDDAYNIGNMPKLDIILQSTLVNWAANVLLSQTDFVNLISTLMTRREAGLPLVPVVAVMTQRVSVVKVSP